jgi:formylglycine-generating enzyme required for sulfatase activity
MSTCQSSVSGYTGIYDMSGNAVEWEDSCGDSTPTASCRVHGGGWGSGTPFVDCAINAVNDGYWGRKNERNDLGFRCCYQ